MGRRSLRFNVYAWSVVGLTVAGVAWASQAYHFEPSWAMAGLAMAAVAAELLAVNLQGSGGLSLTYPLAVSGIVLLGPLAGVVITGASSLPYLIPGRVRPLSKTAFNASQFILMALVPGAAYVLAGGLPLAYHPLTAADFPGQVLPLLLAGWLGAAVNLTLASGGYALYHGVSIRRVWRETASWMLPSQLALGLVGLAIAQVLSDQGAMGFALFVIPLLVARQVHQRTLGLREAYADTVRSLVAAIEAKDPYTKGHSVRVARFAVDIGRAMSLDEQEIERLEYAALLHDLGKIGISRAVLSKPSGLTAEEYTVIQRHPDIGARILESVPFLDDVRPVVQAHHERIDGRGYGRGLDGSEIPLSARILAVADCFDAMTAERPYRAALSESAAVAELRAGSGTQFDPVVVEVLIGALPGIPSGSDPNAANLAPQGGPAVA